ncbi:MAG: preprotein translocase subunit SecA [Verrucomicrobiales bacterium]|jgi:preprotein translocase subunit SecA
MMLPAPSFRMPPKLHTGADAAVNGAIGMWQRRRRSLRAWQRRAQQIDEQAEHWSEMRDHDLKENVRHFAAECCRHRDALSEETLLATAAALREVAQRRLGLRPFSVQMMGVLALHEGYLVEMATGEGKTLAAGLAAALAGFSKRPSHVITVNDYLVARDAKRLRPFFEFCGLKVGTVIAEMPPDERRTAYACDITYVTSKEVLADFLRDRIGMADVDHPDRRLIRQMLRPRSDVNAGLVLPRGLHSAIVDEADSVLIDEAVTPLIISQQRKNADLEEVVRRASLLAAHFECETDYRVNLEYREIDLSPAGKTKLVELANDLGGMWHGPERRWELLRTALVAREFYLQGKQYVITDDKIVIVDEFTGRPMAQRTWRQGLHQAVEAKENLAITPPSETLARLSFQRYFRCYHKLSGMTGTAQEAANEFWQIYDLPVVKIPTNKPCIRAQWRDQIFTSDQEKWRAIVDSIAEIHRSERPILVGTRSVMASEKLAEALAAVGLTCQVLNATRMAEEAMIIARAGTKNRITIATNMAGRGTDIELDPGVAALGGLHVIATECHESYRVDRQLYGRAARQGDPGSAQLFLSQEDELFRKFASRAERRIASTMAAAKPLVRRALKRTQGRAEHQAYKQRRGVLKTDDWLESALSFTRTKSV